MVIRAVERYDAIMSEAIRPDITELIGIYNANGGFTGELTYLAGKLFRNQHCALCDITHGLLSEKSAFKACKSSLELPLKTLHINEQEESLALFTEGKTPCVVGRTVSGFEMLLDREVLEKCNKSVEAFTQALERALG